MSESKNIGLPKPDSYSIEEAVDLVKAGEFNRGDFVIDSDGKGAFKFSRLQKRKMIEGVSKDDMMKLFETGMFTRGAYALTCLGDTYNVYRYQKQWVQKLS